MNYILGLIRPHVSINLLDWITAEEHKSSSWPLTPLKEHTWRGLFYLASSNLSVHPHFQYTLMLADKLVMWSHDKSLTGVNHRRICKATLINAGPLLSQRARFCVRKYIIGAFDVIFVCRLYYTHADITGTSNTHRLLSFPSTLNPQTSGGTAFNHTLKTICISTSFSLRKC